MTRDGTNRVTDLRESAPETNRVAAQERPVQNQSEQKNYCRNRGAGKKQMARRSLKRHRQRSRKQNKPERNQRELRSHIEKTVRDISRDDRRRVRAARNPHGQPRDVTADNGRQEECAEQPAGVALRAGREAEFCAGGIHYDVPLGDAAGQRDEINQKHRQKTCQWYPRQRVAKLRHREKMKQQREDRKRC